MGFLRRLFALPSIIEQPEFAPDDSRDSFLARIRIRKLLSYTRLASIILLIAGPVAFFLYPAPGGRPLGVLLFVFGGVAFFLTPLLCRWKNLEKHSNWIPILMTTFFLVPAMSAIALNPDQERGRAVITLGIATSTYCLSRMTFAWNYLVIAAAWIITWHLCGLEFGPDDGVFSMLVVPAVGYIICAIQTDSMVALFDLNRQTVDQQHTLEETVARLLAETERRQAEGRLRQQSREQLEEQQTQLLHVSRVSAMGELVAGISHEVRQPLHALSMYASVLQSTAARDPIDRKRLTECVDKVCQLTDHTSEIIRRLQNFVRHGQHDSRPLNLSDVAHDAMQLTASEKRRLRIDIELHAEENVSQVRGDCVQLQQVVVNLIRNAIDAIVEAQASERLIEIDVRQNHDWVLLNVRDTGLGITDEQAARIFETFYSTKSGGLGVGMSISRRIAEAHGGRLTLVSSNGPGADFELALPAIDRDRQAVE
ncbi:MAG: sensor histidine kinase [Planctomycetota bacterium]|jgi:signal transduction histidine kinase